MILIAMFHTGLAVGVEEDKLVYFEATVIQFVKVDFN